MFKAPPPFPFTPDMLVEHWMASASGIDPAEQIQQRVRLIRPSYLSPRIVEAIIEGGQPATMP